MQVSDADDGDLTNDLANTGQQVGQLMLDTIPAAGNEVPGRRKLLQPGGPGGGGPGGGPGELLIKFMYLELYMRTLGAELALFEAARTPFQQCCNNL